MTHRYTGHRPKDVVQRGRIEGPVNLSKTLDEQRKFAADMDAFAVNADRLEESYRQEIKLLDQRRRALLQRTFGGRL